MKVVEIDDKPDVDIIFIFAKDDCVSVRVALAQSICSFISDVITYNGLATCT